MRQQKSQKNGRKTNYILFYDSDPNFLNKSDSESDLALNLNKFKIGTGTSVF